MGKYCGDSIPPSHVSSSNEFLIHFQSDGFGTYGGFQMEYNPKGNTSIQNNTEYHRDMQMQFFWYLFFHCLKVIKICNNTLFSQQMWFPS